MLREIGSSAISHRLLYLYAESHELKRASDNEVATMSSPLRSQESVCSSNGSCDDNENIRDHEELENNEIRNGSQPFHTQISPSPAPKRKRQPLTSKQPRVHQDSRSEGKVNTPDTSLFDLTRIGSQVPMCAAGSPMNTVEGASEEVVNTPRNDDALQKSAPLSRTTTAPTEMPPCRQGCKPLRGGHWPGGRTHLLNGRYLPRRLTKVCKDQQEILEDPNAWQPSKADRRIRGSIPIQILNIFTEAVDRTAEIGPDRDSVHRKEPSVTEELGEDVQLDNGRPNATSDVVSERSASPQSTSQSWSLTPRSPALSEPAFPENSSPLRAPQRRVTPSLPQRSSPNASTDDNSQQELTVSNVLAMPFKTAANAGNIEQAVEGGETLSREQILSPSIYAAADTAISDEDRPNICTMPLPQHGVPPERKVAQAQGNDLSEGYSSQSKSGKASQQTDSITTAPQTQKALRYEKAGGNGLIQVQRTPFTHQAPNLVNTPGSFCEPVIFPNTNTDDSLTKDRGPKSSPSVVPGTFMNIQTERCRRTRAAGSRSPDDDLDSAEDEQMGEKGGSKMAHVSRSAEATDAASEAHPASPDEALSESAERSCRHRNAKRKHCSDHYAHSMVQPGPAIQGRQPLSSPAASKRPRMMPSFPSLEALKDFNSGKTPSEIARQSRRAFFRNQHEAASNSSPPSTSTPLHDQLDKAKCCASPRASDCETSHSRQPRHTTPGTSLFSCALPKVEIDVDGGSRSHSRRQNVYDSYRVAYPDYEGDALQFHKACKQIRALHRDGKAPHPSLWDDFIFRRHHDYRDYLLHVTRACEDALPYLQYYTEQVERPLRMQLVVRPAYVSSLEEDSAPGSSIPRPAPAAPVDINARENPEKSVAASSSASHIPPARHIMFPTNTSQCRPRRELGCAPGSDQQDELNQTQESCVKQWVELQSVRKELGVESPELGFADVTMDENDVPQQNLDYEEEVRAPSPPGRQVAAIHQEEPVSVWCDDPNTPFKSFARSHAALASEKRQLKEALQVDRRGCLKPHLQNVIDIFTLYKK